MTLRHTPRRIEGAIVAVNVPYSEQGVNTQAPRKVDHNRADYIRL